MKKRLFTFLVILFIAGIFFSVPKEVYADTKYDLGKGYTMWLHNPDDDGKPYYHIHFYYKGKQVYCLRLDTLQPCDSFKKNPLPNWVMKKAKEKVGNSKWGYSISKNTIGWGKALAVAGAALLVIVATICPFDGAAGDAVAWGILLGVV